MIIILALVVLIAAVVVGVAAVLGNRGIDHALVHPFSVLGYHVTGSEGRLFLYGMVVGAVGVAALCLLLAAARRTSRRGSDARRGLRQARQEAAHVPRARDRLSMPPATNQTPESDQPTTAGRKSSRSATGH